MYSNFFVLKCVCHTVLPDLTWFMILKVILAFFECKIGKQKKCFDYFSFLVSGNTTVKYVLFFQRKLDKPKTSWYHCGKCFCINGNLCWQQSPAGCAISDWITENMRACPAWNSCKIPPFRSNLRPESGKPATCDPCEAAAQRYTRSDIFIGPAAASRSLRGARVLSILRQLSSLVWSPLKWHLGTFLIFLFKLWGQTCKVNNKISKVFTRSSFLPFELVAEILWHGKKLEKP